MVMRIIYFLVLILWVSPVIAQEKGIWVTVTGEAFMSKTDTLLDVERRAKNDARYKALEQAVGCFLKASTVIYNARLAEDLINVAVKGRIIKESFSKLTPDKELPNHYTITLKAYIEPTTPKRGTGFEAEVSLNKKRFYEEDRVEVYIKASQTCYLYLFSVGADGAVTLLFPNRYNKNNQIEANKVFIYPTKVEYNLGYPLIVKFPADFQGEKAVEKVKVICTTRPEPLLKLGFEESFFKVYSPRETGMVSDLVKKLSFLDIDEWAEATAVYEILRRKNFFNRAKSQE